MLKIFVHLCSHGSDQFLTELRRNSTFIQQASGSSLHFLNLSLTVVCPLLLSHLHFPLDGSVYSGPPDPIHGTALFQKVRNTAQVRGRLCLCDRAMKYLNSVLNVFFFFFFVYTHRKWLGYFSQTQFPSKVTLPQLTWSPQQWVSSSRDLLTHMNSFCPTALKGHFHKDTLCNQIARDLTF